MKITEGAKSGLMMGDQTLPMEYASGASLLQYAAEHCYEEGQYLRITFLVACSEVKESNYSTHSTFGGTLHCFSHVYRLTTRSKLQVQCVEIDGHTRDITQHICAKLHLILTVVPISRPIGPRKKLAS